MIILFIVLWVLSGWTSFIYWWTNEYAFTTGDIPVMLLQSFTGPFAFIAGWVMHGDGSGILIPKRK